MIDRFGPLMNGKYKLSVARMTLLEAMSIIH